MYDFLVAFVWLTTFTTSFRAKKRHDKNFSFSAFFLPLGKMKVKTSALFLGVKMAWCSVSTCGNSKDKRPDLSYFHVPTKENIWKQWLINGGREDLLEKTPQYAHSNIKFCSEHFEDDKFVSIIKKNRLEIGAVPTIFKQSVPPGKKLIKNNKLLEKSISIKKNSKENKNSKVKSSQKIPEIQKEERKKVKSPSTRYFTITY